MRLLLMLNVLQDDTTLKSPKWTLNSKSMSIAKLVPPKQGKIGSVPAAILRPREAANTNRHLAKQLDHQ